MNSPRVPNDFVHRQEPPQRCRDLAVSERMAVPETRQQTRCAGNSNQYRQMCQPDPEIARDPVHAMKLNVTVPDEKIKLLVNDGFVTIEGTVDWDFQRRGAELCVRNVAGVLGVVNHLKIKPRVSVGEVSSKIEEALRRNAELDARRITVSATDGKVHLYGSVRSWFEREEAERAAWSSPGVAEVVDRISIVP